MKNLLNRLKNWSLRIEFSDQLVHPSMRWFHWFAVIAMAITTAIPWVVAALAAMESQ